MTSNSTSPIEPLPQSSTKDAADIIENEYHALRGIAARHMRDERENHTLTGTALANEVAARMLNNSQTPMVSRGQFLTFADKAMRHYLIDYARTRGRQKRGGDLNRQGLQEDVPEQRNTTDEAEAIEEALDLLAEHNTRQAEIIRLRFKEGLTNEQVANQLDISVATVKRDWHVARAWLAAQLRGI